MKNHKSFLAGMLTMLLIMGLVGTASATRAVVQKEIEYRDIKVSLDGTVLDLRDAQGNAVEPFMFDGTNYIPARALAEALGLTVAWDSANSTVVLTHPQAAAPQPSNEPAPAPGTSGGTAPSGGTGDGNNFNTWDLPENQQTDARFVLNTSTLKIHEPSCREVKKIAPQNYQTSNEDPGVLMGQGYSYCGVCH